MIYDGVGRDTISLSRSTDRLVWTNFSFGSKTIGMSGDETSDGDDDDDDVPAVLLLSLLFLSLSLSCTM